MSEVTVLVPSYNHAPFIERCLRSILAQTRPPHRLIVIDDGSNDGSPEVIRRVLRDCPFPHEFVARGNRGLCATLNEGFEKVGTQYFAYLGSDDVWFPEFLEKRIGLLEERTGAVLAFGHAWLIDEDDNIFDSTAGWRELPDGDMLPTLLEGSAFPSPSVVYRTEFLKNHRWNEDSRLEDYEMYLKLATEGEFARDEEILCAWRVHGSNTSGDWSMMFEEIVATQRRLRDMLGLSEEELERRREKLSINTVDQFIRTGDPRRAFSLLRQHHRAADSYAHLACLVLRLLVPQKLFQWNRRRKKRNAIRKYGKLNLDSTSAGPS